jgi:hypothetical protein
MPIFVRPHDWNALCKIGKLVQGDQGVIEIDVTAGSDSLGSDQVLLFSSPGYPEH